MARVLNERRWSSPAELRAAVIAYVATWWHDDPGIRALAADDPGLMARLESIAQDRLVGTADVYRIAHGRWLTDRVKLHDAIVKEQLVAATEIPEPIAYFTIGPMGSGKTSILRPLVDRHRAVAGRSGSVTVVCADEVRRHLPEYNDGLGSLVVQEECFDVTYSDLFPRAVERHADMVFDTIGTFTTEDRPSIAPSVEVLRDHGYEIQMLVADAPLELCEERATQRALLEGRLVDAEAHRATHRQPMRVLERVRDEGWLEGWAIVDTSTPPPCLPINEGTVDWWSLQDDVPR